MDEYGEVSLLTGEKHRTDHMMGGPRGSFCESSLSNPQPPVWAWKHDWNHLERLTGKEAERRDVSLSIQL